MGNLLLSRGPAGRGTRVALGTSEPLRSYAAQVLSGPAPGPLDPGGRHGAFLLLALVQPTARGTWKLRMCTQRLLAYLMPASTAMASWSVRLSARKTSESNTLGQMRARPVLGVTVMLSFGNRVPPPASTSLR